MKQILLPDPVQAWRDGLRFEYSGFDEVFFVADGRPTPTFDRALMDSDPKAFLQAYGTHAGDLEYLGAIVIQGGWQTGIIGTIAEVHPEIGRWLLAMMLRQRVRVAEYMERQGIPTPPNEKDRYSRFVGDCHAAFARTKAHSILGEIL